VPLGDPLINGATPDLTDPEFRISFSDPLGVCAISRRGTSAEGQIKALASAPGVLKPHVETGTLRVLASWEAQRIASFPDLPTFRELGYPDVEFYIWAGLFAPIGLPPAVLGKLEQAVQSAMSDPQIRQIFEKAGSPPAFQDAAAFKLFMEADNARLIAATHRIGSVE